MKLTFRKAVFKDVQLYFNWANDKLVRENSFNKNEITLEQHINWFNYKLNSPDCFFYLFLNEQQTAVGQVRIDNVNYECIIGISIDENFRGKGLGTEMLNQACNAYFEQAPNGEIIAYVKEENTASLKLFTSAGFIKIESVMVGTDKSYKFKKQNK